MSALNPQSRQNNNPWDENPDPLWLLTEEEFNSFPDGVVFECISGEKKTKGVDYIDMDTRFGMIAWGLRESTMVGVEKEQEQIV